MHLEWSPHLESECFYGQESEGWNPANLCFDKHVFCAPPKNIDTAQ